MKSQFTEKEKYKWLQPHEIMLIRAIIKTIKYHLPPILQAEVEALDNILI